jgi:hypothetical protein
MIAVLKIIGILVGIFLFGSFTISVGVEIGLRAYFEHYRKDKQLEENKGGDVADVGDTNIQGELF